MPVCRSCKRIATRPRGVEAGNASGASMPRGIRRDHDRQIDPRGSRWNRIADIDDVLRGRGDDRAHDGYRRNAWLDGRRQLGTRDDDPYRERYPGFPGDLCRDHLAKILRSAMVQRTAVGCDPMVGWPNGRDAVPWRWILQRTRWWNEIRRYILVRTSRLRRRTRCGCGGRRRRIDQLTIPAACGSDGIRKA